ncbi:MAG: M14 family zinc carboxypeptidase, partial [Candidatus Firestonebacteria bacterium]
DKEWQFIVPQSMDGSVVTFVIKVPPGGLDLAQYPTYNLPELKKDLKRWEKAGIFLATYGKSEKKRALPLLVLGEKGKNKEKVFVFIRNHAYESAGSYCCRGIVDFLLSRTEMAKYLLNKFTFYLLPMTNIDGVEDGMSRLTAPQGANLNRHNTSPDASVSALQSLIEKERQELVMNYHNWQSKFKDGMWCLSAHYQKMIAYYLSDIYSDCKRLDSYVVQKKKFDPGFEKASLHDFIEHKYGSITVTYEFPWFSRTTERMEKIGEKSFVAFLLARIEEKQNK